MEAAKQKGREKQAINKPDISFEYRSIFPNCNFWANNNPVRFIERIPMDSFSTVNVCLGCPFSKIPTYVENDDPFDFMKKYDFQALNNCKGAECEWYNTGDKDQ